MSDEAERSPPPAPFGSGPYFAVAIPRQLDAYVPLNVSLLLDEWAGMLNPVEAVAGSGDILNWLSEAGAADRFTTQDGMALSLLRQLARDERIVDRMQLTTQLVSHAPDESGLRIETEGQPIITGLAVVTAIIRPVGLAGRSLYERLR